MRPKTVPREKIPWFPVIDMGRCNGCGVCLEFCPQGVYARPEGASAVLVQNPFSCVVGCNNCEMRCPERAISFPDLEKITEIIRKLREENACSILKDGPSLIRSRGISCLSAISDPSRFLFSLPVFPR